MALDSFGINFLLSYVIPGLVGVRIWGLLHPYGKQSPNELILNAIVFGAICFSIISIFPDEVSINLEGFSWEFNLAAPPSIFAIVVVPFMVAKAWSVLSRRFLLFNRHPSKIAWDYTFGQYLNDKSEGLILSVHLKNGEVIAGQLDKDAFFSDLPDNYQILLDIEYHVDEDGFPTGPKNGSAGILIMDSEISHIQFISGDERFDYDKAEG
ncbi:DUF6338 family protein [Halomonas elongata]|uniref:DUF6338 family protein n=1 Tax=Halomonas elongata TaxID=2746 RepID=UPI0023B1F54E|nr:DUF6338 family protein [Halomonas elongata]